MNMLFTLQNWLFYLVWCVNSHIHAAYANFLWEIEDEEDENDETQTQPMVHTVATASITVWLASTLSFVELFAEELVEA